MGSGRERARLEGPAERGIRMPREHRDVHVVRVELSSGRSSAVPGTVPRNPSAVKTKEEHFPVKRHVQVLVQGRFKEAVATI